ncbi:MAG: sigma factor [Verrucomicrobiota bacterium]
MNTSGANEERSRQKLLVGLLLKHQRAMFAYIFSLVPNKSDADDILQETCLTIHEKFDDFEEGTNFLLWANRISYWKVRESRQKFARSKVIFSDAVMELVSLTDEKMQREDPVRHEALAHCLKKLKDRDRRMILARYEPDGGAEEAARVSERSLTATYKALGRIKRVLFDCVSQRAALDGGTFA